jgi:hypothetical protein
MLDVYLRRQVPVLQFATGFAAVTDMGAVRLDCGN